jgi:leucyl aminopeptidase
MALIKKTTRLAPEISTVVLLEDTGNVPAGLLTDEELAYLQKQREKNEKELIVFNRFSRLVIIQFIKKDKSGTARLESCRIAGDKIASLLNEHKYQEVILLDAVGSGDETLALAEGMALGNYQFIKYKKELKNKKNSLARIGIKSAKVGASAIERINVAVESVYRCRDLVNEPLASMNAVKLAAEFEKMGNETGARVEVLNRKKIEALKMGGLLAVNRGSVDPPTFTIYEWKPNKPVNSKPYILVGKGIVFDTGGMNIKTGNYLDTMKCDMSGAAAVACVIYAIAKLNMPLHVIGLIPATDNRPGGNAYVPGDVIYMHDGTTVEVLNTDAEGRLILADALSYAKKYDPVLVIDLATLTGAAAMAIGKYGIVAMKSKSDTEFELLKKSGVQVYERLVEFPFWDEYAELIKSDVAEIKNIGGKEGGAITAGKFLEHFTDYPYIHLDIAGPAFTEKKDSYRGQGGTGTGVRLLIDFLSKKCRSINDQ